MPNVTLKPSSIQGQGVFAQRPFHKGEVILQIDDSHVVTDETTLTPEDWEVNADFFDGKIVLMQEPERSINHSCAPSCYVKTIDGIRKVLALRDIAEGEEITFDYAINGDNDGAFPCHCGAARCRGVTIGDYFKLPIELQLEYLPFLDEWFSQQYRAKIKALKDNS